MTERPTPGRRLSSAMPPVPDRTTLSGAQRASTGIVGLVLVLLGGAGMLTSRLNGDAPGSLPPVAIGVAALGLGFLLLAVRGRTFGWLPARRPALLGQLTLTVAVVTLVALGRAVAAVRADAAGQIIGWGTVILAAALVLTALVRRWVPGLGDTPRR
jgi:hypothetical protein